MWIKPPFALILSLLLANGFFLYNYYRLWFKTEKFYDEIRKGIQKTPSWYPLKGYYVWRIEKRKSWEIEQKIIGGFGVLVLIGVDILIIIASIFGTIK